MTGGVPYYGGRLSPAQAYAVSHQAQRSATSDREPETLAPGELTEKLAMLQQLLDDDVLTEDEYQMLRRRVLA
jgi:hypothetical protein